MIVPDMSTAPTVVVRRDGPGPRSGSPTPGTDVAGRGPERGPGGSARRRRVSNFRIIYPYRYFMLWMLTVILELNFVVSNFCLPFVPKPVQMKLKFNSTGMGGGLGIVSLFSDAF